MTLKLNFLKNIAVLFSTVAVLIGGLIVEKYLRFYYESNNTHL